MSAQIHREQIWSVLLYKSNAYQQGIIFQDQIRPIQDDENIDSCSLCDLGF